MHALLISTYDLGRHPFGLASPAAWVERAGATVECLDLAVQELDEDAVRRADVIGFHLPMHTATRITLALLPRIRQLNDRARLCAWGLYAPIAATELRRRGVEFLVGGEFEGELVRWLSDQEPSTVISHDRLEFLPPRRTGLPPLDGYARLRLPDGSERVVGATEASRGCKHLCRHCPVVPVYEGRFRVVPVDIVLADIESLAERGAEHVTFGDPDFLNGPGHAARVVRALDERFPRLSYDVTVKVEHLLRHRELLPLLRDTGCVLVTSAVESFDDRVLQILDKGHTRDDFLEALDLCRRVGLDLQPTFVPFHPWSSLGGHEEMLRTLAELDLVGGVAPIQLAIRLLIPRGSRLLELPETRARVGEYDEDALSYVWSHEDPRVDALQRRLEALVEQESERGSDRGTIFRRAWEMTTEAASEDGRGSASATLPELPARATIPYLTEPWYC